MPLVFAILHGLNDFNTLLKKNDLEYIPLIFSDGALSFSNFPAVGKLHPRPGKSVTSHLDVMYASINELQSHDIMKRVPYINCHSGGDYFTKKEMVEFYTKLSDFEIKNKLSIGHETHRSRAFYSPFVTRDILHDLPPSINFTAGL